MTKTPKHKARPSHWLNQAETVRSCRVSPSGFAKWNVTPVARIGRHTYYEIADILENRLAAQARRLEAQTPPPPVPPSDLATGEREEKLRLTRAQADWQELKNAQTRRELAPIKLIEYVLADAGRQITAIMDTLPSQLKKRNPKLTATDLEIIRREIAKAMNICADIQVDLDAFEPEEPAGLRQPQVQ